MPKQTTGLDEVLKEGHVAGAFFKTLLEATLARGVSREMLAQALNTEIGHLENPPETVPQALYLSLLQAARNLSNDDNFGLHIGELVHTSTYTVLGYTLMSCKHLGQALQQVLRFEGLVHDLGSSEVTLQAELVEYSWLSHYDNTPWQRDLAESTFSGLITFANQLAGKRVPVLSVDFAHPKPASTLEHKRIFGAPVRFSQATNQISFPSYLANWPVAHADTSMFTVLEKHAEQLVKVKAQQQGIVGEVRRVLMQSLAKQETQIGAVAERMHVSTRTLQRKLKDEGLNFQAVLDDLRREMSQYYLLHSKLSVMEIAFLLGYQAQSSFNHAFKEWSGTSPKLFRENQ